VLSVHSDQLSVDERVVYYRSERHRPEGEEDSVEQTLPCDGASDAGAQDGALAGNGLLFSVYASVHFLRFQPEIGEPVVTQPKPQIISAPRNSDVARPIIRSKTS
jgi:hypothetical protein